MNLSVNDYYQATPRGIAAVSSELTQSRAGLHTIRLEVFREAVCDRKLSGLAVESLLVLLCIHSHRPFQAMHDCRYEQDKRSKLLVRRDKHFSVCSGRRNGTRRSSLELGRNHRMPCCEHLVMLRFSYCLLIPSILVVARAIQEVCTRISINSIEDRG